jgi:hypothetical protein
MGDLIGWAFFLGIASLGIASTVLATISTWRFVRRHRAGNLASVLVVTGVAMLAFMGLWIVFDICWLFAKAVSRLSGSTARKAPAT